MYELGALSLTRPLQRRVRRHIRDYLERYAKTTAAGTAKNTKNAPRHPALPAGSGRAPCGCDRSHSPWQVLQKNLVLPRRHASIVRGLCVAVVEQREQRND